MQHPFRFGVMANHTTPMPSSGRQWADFCKKVEDLGYASLALSDHLWGQPAPVPAIAAAAAATSQLRVGALMFCNDFRHPAILAKEVATLDVLADGRLDLGIGAGWKDTDYQQTGIAKDRAGVRIERLAESVSVIKGLLGDEPFTFDGQHYSIDGLDNQPKPIQRPHPPLIMGGGGPKVLRLAAEHAQIVSVNRSLRDGEVDRGARRNSSAEATDEKITWVREVAGARWKEIEINMVVPDVVITAQRRRAVTELAQRFGLTPEEVEENPHVWVGTVDQICDDLMARRERFGASFVTVVAEHFEASAPVIERLAGR